MRLFLVILSLLTGFYGFSQKEKSKLPVITLRAMPSSFMEVDAGAMLGLGIQVAPRWEVDIDPMWIFYAPYSSAENEEGEQTDMHGYKLRTAVKYYLRDYEYAGKPKLFFALEWHYKKTSETKWETFGVNRINNQYAYFQRDTYDEVQTENGGSIKTGFMTKLWSPRWAMEVYAGIGLKYKKRSQRNMPAGAEFLNDPNANQFFTFTTGTVPMLPVGAKFLFRIY